MEFLVGFHVLVFSFSEESVKDLIRYLRYEDETRDVRQQLGAAQILQNDLLPILAQHRQDKPLFDAVIRFLPQLFYFCHMPAFVFVLIGLGVCAGQGNLIASSPVVFPRLMVNLTQPALLCFGSVPKEPSMRHHFLQVLTYLQAYKEVRPSF